MNYVKVSREVRGPDGSTQEAHSVQCNRGEDTCHVVIQRDGHQNEGEITKGELEGLVREAVLSMLPQKRGIPDLREMLKQGAQGGPIRLVSPEMLQGLPHGRPHSRAHSSVPYGLPHAIPHHIFQDFGDIETDDDEPRIDTSRDEPTLQPLSQEELEGLLTEASQMKKPREQREHPCEYTQDTDGTTQLEKYMKATDDSSTSETPVPSSKPKVVAIQPEQLQKLIASLQPMEGVFV